MKRFVHFWLAAFGATLAARWRRGPLRPSWSLIMETTVAYLRADLADAAALPVPEARVAMEQRPLPRDAIGKVRREVVADGPLRGEWVRGPHARRPEEGTILYLHGGSYLFGSPRTHADTLARLALVTGRPVLAPEYRLAPEHPYPAQLEDEGRAWCDRARAAGVALTVDEPVHLPHAPPFFASVSDGGRNALTAVADFIRRRFDA
jgi:acetyl esterase/lipase